MKLLIPLVLALVGLGGGLAAGHFMRPPPPEPPAAEAEAGAPDPAEAPEPGAEMSEKDAHPDGPPPPFDPEETHEYVKLDRQFVVPLVKEEVVEGLIIVTLSVEVDEGMSGEVSAREPKLRDRFLQVLFRHAQSGAFEGVFTAGPVMRDLRGSLLEAARSVLGPVVHGVLVTDIMRQDM